MEQLRELYRQWCGREAAAADRLPGAGSNRAYYRLRSADGQTVIGCIGTSAEENHAFIYLARHFAAKGLPVPEVLAVSADEMRYLQTDLGTTSLFDALRQGREAGGNYSAEECQLLRQTIRLLPAMQFEGGRGLDFEQCYPQPSFDEEGVMFDLNYFKYCFLKATGLDFHELRLEHDFRLLARLLTCQQEDLPADTFLYRDFQARNIMVNDGVPGQPCTLFLIDFQGGRRGPFYYDLASFLWQASARYPDALRQQLVDEYYEAAQHFTTMPPRRDFDKQLRLFVLFRTLQVLGAYGFRGYFERKPHFVASIPPAIDNLRRLLEREHKTPDGSFLQQLPALADVLQRLVVLPRFTQQASPSAPACGPLVVRVFSFSYKKGIPEDESGNGGGYVFDCRATHNPGRYDAYKQLTGLDEPVIRFLEDDGEIVTFLQSVYRLANAHVERYIERGFTSLTFSFGCTGGQHRSVYCAQHLAEHISARYGVEVRLCHRERGISQLFAETKSATESKCLYNREILSISPSNASISER